MRGPMAVLLGGGAIGGIIDVRTRAAQAGPARVAASIAYGSFDTLTIAGSLGLPLGDALRLSIDATRDRSEGWSDAWELDRTLREISAREDARGTERTHVGARVGWRVDGSHELELRLRAHGDRRLPAQRPRAARALARIPARGARRASARRGGAAPRDRRLRRARAACGAPRVGRTP